MSSHWNDDLEIGVIRMYNLKVTLRWINEIVIVGHHQERSEDKIQIFFGCEWIIGLTTGKPTPLLFE